MRTPAKKSLASRRLSDFRTGALLNGTSVHGIKRQLGVATGPEETSSLPCSRNRGIIRGHLGNRTRFCNPTVFQTDGDITDGGNCPQIMADENDRPSLGGNVTNG
jgi:hypothetical protein